MFPLPGQVEYLVPLASHWQHIYHLAPSSEGEQLKEPKADLKPSCSLSSSLHIACRLSPPRPLSLSADLDSSRLLHDATPCDPCVLVSSCYFSSNCFTEATRAVLLVPFLRLNRVASRRLDLASTPRRASLRASYPEHHASHPRFVPFLSRSDGVLFILT